MAKLKKIEYYDLRTEAKAKKLPFLVGRRAEAERIARVVGRRMNNNVLIVGPSGSGKTALAHGWIRSASAQERHANLEFIQFTLEHLHTLESAETEYAEGVLGTLPACVLFIDNFGRALYNRSNTANDAFRTYTSLLTTPDVRVIATMEPHEHEWLVREYPAFAQMFDVIQLKQQAAAEHVRILQAAVPRLNTHRVLVPSAALREIVTYAERFPSLGAMPFSGISLLDECLSHAVAEGERALTSDSIAHVIATKTGTPRTQLSANEIETLAALERTLNAKIIGQEAAIAKIVRTLQRAKLGLRNPNRPLGSFLMLGPSGVGKTETAKLVAEALFGRSESFMRIDMSEFQQDHTIQRLIGAPAGYVGYEEGGALTNLFKKEPHALVLLDEIEKAHPKVFDIFLQVLDDGRLTSGQNETVDARNSIVMATSNVGVDRILKAVEQGTDISSDAFIREELVPALAGTFRLEFLNRFDGILVFNPLSVPALVRIAELEVKKTEQRLAKHKVRFDIDPKELEARIRSSLDPRFGARPVKRFVEDTCESLLAEALLARAGATTKT